MKRIAVVLGCLLLFSCDDFKIKKTSSEAILNEELKKFNWNEVDAYPSFSVCDESLNQNQRKECFQTTLTKLITRKLTSENVVVTRDVRDTILLKFQISKDGLLNLLSVEADSLTYKEIPNLNGLLRVGLDSLPEVYPALKRGQQVTTEFVLPVVVMVD